MFAVKTSLLVLLSCILLLLNTSFHLPAQSPNQQMDIYFEHISLEHGLSQSTVLCILQDSKGFLWFGTEDGLNRYDGYHFKVYKPDPKNPSSLSFNWIWSIFEDHEGILWIGTTGGGLNKFDRKTEMFTHYKRIPEDPTSLSNNFVFSIIEDQEGMLWVGTYWGLNKFDRESDKFTHYMPNPEDLNSLSHHSIQVISVDHTGVLWIGTDGGGLNKLEPKKGKFTRYMNVPGNEESLSHNTVRAIYEDSSGVLWVGTTGGLNKFDPQKEKFVRYMADPGNPNSLSHNEVNSIYEDRSGTLWIGTEEGLNVFDREKQIFTHYKANPSAPNSLSYNSIWSIFEDRSGVLWVGTNVGGLNTYNKARERFSHFYSDPNDPNSLSENKVWAIWEERPGLLWIGTAGGLKKWDREKKRVTLYKNDPGNPNSLSHNTVKVIYEDLSGVLWIGTDGGLNKFDREKEIFTRYMADPTKPNRISHNIIYSIYEDRTGILWIGTFGGLNKFNRKKETFTCYKYDPGNPNSLSHSVVRVILEDRFGVFWIGTGGGLNKFDPDTETFTCYAAVPGIPDSLSHNNIYSIHEDQSKTLWIGTAGGGLNKLDRERKTFIHYNMEDGLPNDVIYGILEDEHGNLWLSTNKGLSMFNPQTERFKNYGIKDGLQSNEFNSGACYRSKSGEMFFGGINGFNAFFPGTIKDNTYKPPIVITDFQIFNKSVSIGQKLDGFTILNKDISETQEIRLSYKHTIFSFEYAGLHYAVPDKNQYAYKMEGLEKDWNYVENRRFATYTYLPPGKYIFKVKGSNSDEVWNEEGVSLKVTIVPPFWKTGWFYLLCILFFLLLILGLHRLRVRRLKNQEKRLTQLVNERTQELEKVNRYKSDFLARMSHEIRTPMNSIIGFADLVLDTQLNEDQYDFIKAIRESGEVLLDIINEILDLSKIEAGQLSLKSIDFDPKVMAYSVCELFIPRIEEKPIQILCVVDNEVPLNVKGDPGRFRQVLINLMGNAVKFTQEGEVALAIHMEKEENHRVKLHTKVRDTGIGIPEDKRDSIFKAFQQADVSTIREYGGTGLGLSICTHIAQLMGGNIWVESKPRKGSTFHFTAWLEKSRKKTAKKRPPSDEHISEKKAFIKSGRESIPTQHPLMEASRQSVRILMAEDNALNRKLARFMLRKAGYQVDMVTNGKEAVEKFLSNPEAFDLILMDIQMPEMDGYETTRKIREIEKNRKKNLHDSSFILPPSSQIPIIAMTAASMKGDPEKCFEAGMTDYISKPIKKEVLYSVIERWGRWKTRDE
jgi:signal transduction histidine kinase/ligand-binding sensor domain-containing protein/CheY-like chemotaxis protein